jgi:hypothetical protein
LPKTQTSGTCLALMDCSFSQIRSMGLDVVQENPAHLKSGQRPLSWFCQIVPSVMRKKTAVPSGEAEVSAILRVDKHIGACPCWANAVWAVMTSATAALVRAAFIMASSMYIGRLGIQLTDWPPRNSGQSDHTSACLAPLKGGAIERSTESKPFLFMRGLDLNQLGCGSAHLMCQHMSRPPRFHHRANDLLFGGHAVSGSLSTVFCGDPPSRFSRPKPPA